MPKKEKVKKTLRVVKHYTYRDELGKKVYRKEVSKHIDGRKRVYWRCFNEEGTISKTGTSPKEGEKWVNDYPPLYNLPDIYKTRNTDKPVFIVEGEKCVNALKKLGLIVICHPIGSGGKWQKQYGVWMEDRLVLVFADNDDDGMKYAKEMAKGALQTAREVRVVIPWEDEFKGYDVADWIDEHSDKSKEWLVKQLKWFAGQASVCTEWDFLRYKLYSPDDIAKFEDPGFIIDPLIPERAIVVFFAPPFTGKTFVAISWTLSIVLGRSWIAGGNLEVTQGPVGYIATEGKSDYKYRLEAVKKTYRNWTSEHRRLWRREVKFLFNRPLLNTNDVDDVIESFEAMTKPPILVVIDTLRATLKGSIVSDEDMDNYMQAAEGIRDVFNCAVLIIAHTPRTDPKRFMGSQAIAGAADQMLMLERPPETKGEGFVKLVMGDSRLIDEVDDVYLELRKTKTDEEGHTSLYVCSSYYEEFEEEMPKKGSLSAKGYKYLDELRKISETKWTSREDWMIEIGVKHVQTFEKYARFLEKKESIERKGGGKNKKTYFRPL